MKREILILVVFCDCECLLAAFFASTCFPLARLVSLTDDNAQNKNTPAVVFSTMCLVASALLWEPLRLGTLLSTFHVFDRSPQSSRSTAQGLYGW